MNSCFTAINCGDKWLESDCGVIKTPHIIAIITKHIILSILIQSLITSLEIYYPGPGLVVTTDHARAGNDHNEWHHTMNQSGIFINEKYKGRYVKNK